jgi:hypothetical protein
VSEKRRKCVFEKGEKGWEEESEERERSAKGKKKGE